MDPIASQRSFKVEEGDRRDSEGGVSVEEEGCRVRRIQPAVRSEE